MKNQINLIPEVLTNSIGTKERKIYYIALSCAVVAAFIWAVLDFRIYLQHVEKIALPKQQNSEITLKLENLSGEDVAIAENVSALNAEIAELDTLQSQQSRLLSAIRSTSTKADDGFYGFLNLLSSRHNGELYFSYIHLRQLDVQREIRLKGTASSADVLPNYVMQLESALLDNVQFNQLTMQRLGTGEFEFDVATGAEFK